MIGERYAKNNLIIYKYNRNSSAENLVILYIQLNSFFNYKLKLSKVFKKSVFLSTYNTLFYKTFIIKLIRL